MPLLTRLCCIVQTVFKDLEIAPHGAELAAYARKWKNSITLTPKGINISLAKKHKKLELGVYPSFGNESPQAWPSIIHGCKKISKSSHEKVGPLISDSGSTPLNEELSTSPQSGG